MSYEATPTVVVRRGQSRVTLPPQPWQKISGLLPENEGRFTRSERRLALRKLFRHYEQMVRDALAEHDADPEKDERTHLWDPLPMISIELGIARRKLSALTRELTGMSASQVVDRVRAENLPARLAPEVAACLLRRMTPGAHYRVQPGQWQEFLWQKIQAAKREDTHFDRERWALAHGFASYYRFRRGCMLAHGGRTPRELEFEAAGKYAEYFQLAAEHRKSIHALINGTAGEYQTVTPDKIVALQGTPFTHGWAAALRDRPEWLAQMRAQLGLDPRLECVSNTAEWPALTEEQAWRIQ